MQRNLFPLILILFLAIAGAGFAVLANASPEAAVAAQEATATPEMAAMGERQVPQEPAAVATPGGTLPRDFEVQLVKVADGLNDPVAITSAGDGSGRLFVVERPGQVRIVSADGELLDEPFIDLDEALPFGNGVLDAFLEQGLYDIEFHPNYENNGRFFVHFAEILRNGDSMIVEYRVSSDDANRANTDSARVILQIDQPWANHNGGELAFGPDGFLYIGSGDGGWEGDPLETGQTIDDLLGAVLRLDVDRKSSVAPYAIPDDNPFEVDPQIVGLFGIDEDVFADIHTEARPEILHYGLRNPWKFHFDPETGDLFLPDVGQNHWEEINFWPAGGEAGLNYGWDILMGTHCFPIQQEDCPPDFGVLPIAEYSHDLGNAVMSLGVYRGPDYPVMDGVYFAGDWGEGRIWGLAPDEDGVWQMEELMNTTLKVTSGGYDENGSIYITTCDCAYGQQELQPGSVWQLVPADAELPEDAELAPTE
ncbi:MAG: PQQ-dependent sugar dehydrogenase [Candidatus Promineifilaceae bacterium]|nr:PQQ-dependent sugar dehydrogenase [Candidatus Promineifilaceae bacterium]